MSVTDVHHEAVKVFLSKGFGTHIICSTKLEFIGESYRFRQRLRQEEQHPPTEQAETGS